MLSFYAVYAAWSDKKEWIKCVEIWVVAGLPWPHVQFQPQMGLRGGLDFVWPISHLTLPHRAILKVHERRSGQDKSRTAFNPCCFSPQQELGCTKSTGLLILLRVKSSNRTQMKLPGGGTFLGKLDLHHPQTSIYAAVSKYIHSATLGHSGPRLLYLLPSLQIIYT